MYPQVFGKYVLERELARGGMARVILATLRGAGGFEKRLVVKQIRDELALDQAFVRRFVEEAKTTVALSHPNIVPVYELGVEQGTYFLAMELVDGVSVAELVQSGRTLSPEEGAYVGVEVCRALDYAHRRGSVVHRDLTPRNVMIDEEGQVKVIDFGIAAPARAGGVEVFGSPGHMPPEQMRGEELGPPTDLFAVAVLLMEAWSGKPPFRRKTPEECEAAMRAPHPKPSDVDIRLLPLDEVIGRAMALDPKDRPQSADEMGRALRKFLQGLDVGDLARGLGERVKRRRALMKPTPLGMPSERRPSVSAHELETRTFAAREEVQSWSTHPPPSSERGAGSGPSTRKMASEAPPPQGNADRIETVATRPLETPVEQRRARGAKQASYRAPLVGGALLLAVAVVAWVGARGAGTAEPAAAPPRAMATVTVTSSAPAAPPAPSPPPFAPPTRSASAPPPSAPASVAEGVRARLSLFGDPGTRAIVDGTPRGECPIAELAIEPGDHDIRFVFGPTGETSGKRVTVRPGDRLRVRADFAGATPVVTVQH